MKLSVVLVFSKLFINFVDLFFWQVLIESNNPFFCDPNFLKSLFQTR